MKYWRGYLIAAIFAAITLAFREFAATHTKLVDMIYPYITRMVQNFMAGWSGAVDFCVWQVLLLALAVVAFASIVLLVVFRWNIIEWGGWILAAITLVMLLHTGVYGMNEFSGPIREDLRLTEADCSQEQLESAATYFRDKANELSDQVSREGGQVKAQSLKVLNETAKNGFEHLVYDQYHAVFAGSTAPVKELGMSDYFTARGEMGHTAAITGEAAINLQAPAVMQPYAVCREMCYRMCISSQRDKHFGAFMACIANDDVAFQYAGYLAAYRYCLNALPSSSAQPIASGANDNVAKDLAAWEAFVTQGDEEEIIDPDEYVNKLIKKETNKPTQDEIDQEIARLMVSWHQQEIVLPSLVEPEVEFDPYDETMVDLTGLPYGPEPTEAVTEATEAAA